MGERAAVHRMPYERSCCPASWRLLRGPSELLGQGRGVGAGRGKVATSGWASASVCVPGVLEQRLTECLARGGWGEKKSTADGTSLISHSSPL